MARAYNQAQKFGAEMAIPDEAIALDAESDPKGNRFVLRLASGEQVNARSVVIASGARYRRLNLPDLCAVEGSSVHYWASTLEAKLCEGQEVVLVGGGNSAGQAVVYLSSQVAKVWLLVRGPSLAVSMSSYSSTASGAFPTWRWFWMPKLAALENREGNLEEMRWRLRPSGEEVRRPHPTSIPVSSGLIPTPIGLPGRAWLWTSRVLC